MYNSLLLNTAYVINWDHPNGSMRVVNLQPLSSHLATDFFPPLPPPLQQWQQQPPESLGFSSVFYFLCLPQGEVQHNAAQLGRGDNAGEAGGKISHSIHYCGLRGVLPPPV